MYSPAIDKHNFSFAVPGGYSEWTVWSTCSKSCVGGTHSRSRKCNTPPPKYGGKDCSVLGEAMETKECNKHVCPGAQINLLFYYLIDYRKCENMLPNI